MGNCFISSENEVYSILTREHFDFISHIGQGAFGIVWKCEFKPNSTHYAVKEIQKSLITSESGLKSVQNERAILMLVQNPLIVNLHLAFQDRSRVYLMLDLKSGGDFRYHLLVKRSFSEKQCKFFACCVLTGLEYLHSQGVIHRDLKPENLIFDERGYLHLTDFGISQVITQEECRENTGTPGYMAPEVLLNKPHGLVSDFFSLGVILFEALMGKRPFSGHTRAQIAKETMAGSFAIQPDQVRDGVSKECCDFVNQLLCKNPSKRLGQKGVQQVKQHCWLRKVKWEAIAKKSAKPPFLPALMRDFERFAKLSCSPKKQSDKLEGINSRLAGYFYVSPVLQSISENLIK